ncbi:hypothetical protein AA309_08365 [Microvirga vignae]|uniref:Uncharacterized protein n=1 Tax=Microvirga vignae TaxID=1225564 RepID=A0A0H1RDW3_9HYPH|nr:hypothetical protein AA309_08365 [Microvirga vignae]
MPITMCSNLMPSLRNLPHQPWMPISYPTQDKKSRANLVFRQEPQYSLCVGHDPARLSVPISAINNVFEGVSLIMLFYVNA